jgi:acyl carrier protein
MDKFTYDNSQYPKEIPEKISEFLVDYIGDNFKYMSYDDNFKDLGFDSLDIIEIVMNAEKEYGIKIEDWEAEKCNTIGDMVELINSKINGQF